MKVLRVKRFSTKYKNLSPFEIPKEWAGLYDTVETELSIDEKLWEKEITALVGTCNKNRARQIKKSLMESPLNLYNDDTSVGNERTHSLEQFSNDNVQVWSKDISTVDRFLYDVHRPKLIVDERKVVIDVVVQNLSDHKYKGKQYSERITIGGRLRIKIL